MTTVNSNTRLIESDTGTYPLFLNDLRVRHPNTPFPITFDCDLLIEFGYEPVLDSPMPIGDVINEGTPELRDGAWYRTWVVRDYSPEEELVQLNQAKAIHLASIEAFRAQGFERGFPYQVGEVVYHIQVRGVDRGNIGDLRIIAKEAIAEDQPFSVAYRTYENVTITLSAQEMVALANTTLAQVQAGYQLTWDLKDQTAAAQTVEELPSIPSELFTL